MQPAAQRAEFVYVPVIAFGAVIDYFNQDTIVPVST